MAVYGMWGATLAMAGSSTARSMAKSSRPPYRAVDCSGWLPKRWAATFTSAPTKRL